MKINTDSEFYNSEENYLRSSSLKPLRSCSWLYYANSILKLPEDSGNDGARMGSVCHSIFECLAKPHHKRYYDKLMESGEIKGNYRENHAILELVWKLMKKNGLPESDEIYKKIEKMIFVGLSQDFFIEGGTIIGVEYRFKYKNNTPKYFILGTIDKLAIKGNNVIIVDYKSSKQKYKGEDKECNDQALIYSLFASKKWPDKQPIVHFVFLQFPDDPIIELSFTPNILKGFEYDLENNNNKAKNFSEKDAVSYLAAYRDIPKDGSFSGKLLCGFAKYPGQLKKDGTLMFACSCKWKKEYYVLLNQDNKILDSKYYSNELHPQKKERIEKRIYNGCPYYQNKFI